MADTRWWTWNAYIGSYPWTEGGTALKAWRTPEEALADCEQEGIEDGQAIPIVLQTNGQVLGSDDA